MIDTYIQILINGLIVGSLYALVASGLSLIYNVNKFIHLAHGITVTVSAYFMFWIFKELTVNFFVASVLAVLFAGLFGVALYYFLYQPLIKRKTSNIVLLIASFALLLFFENLVLMIFGADVKTYGISSNTLDFAGVLITNIQLTIILLTLAVFGLLWFFLNKSNTGKSLRAISDNKELAEVMGINTKKAVLISFFIGSAIAGLGGVLVGLEQNLEPTMGLNLIIKGFTGAVIGGLTSIPGAIGGSYILGVVENYGVWFLPSQFKEAIAYILLFVFLLFRPTGIFGIKEREQ
jgi:branched-chain amino acid transport system permease protein